MCKISRRSGWKSKTKAAVNAPKKNSLSLSLVYCAEQHSLWTKLKKGFDISLVLFFLFSFRVCREWHCLRRYYFLKRCVHLPDKALINYIFFMTLGSACCFFFITPLGIFPCYWSILKNGISHSKGIRNTQTKTVHWIVFLTGIQ